MYKYVLVVIQEKMFIACGYLHYEITSLLE